jgi:hypothetical protein
VAIERLKRATERAAFAAKHVVPADSGDVPDDAQLRLVVLGPEAMHRRGDAESPAVQRAREMLPNRGATPRLHRNMVVFAAFDEEQFGPLTEAEVCCRAARRVRRARCIAATGRGRR